MKLNKKIESEIKTKAIKYLEARPNWDIGHVLCSVKWIRKLIKIEGGDEKILAPTMYLHDIGYPKLKKGYNYEEVMAAKKIHGTLGARRAKKILSQYSNYFTNDEINKILYLIENHDKHELKKDADLQLVFEADGLAQMDWEEVPPNFDKANCIKWLKKYYKKRKNYFKTKTGINEINKLERQAKKYLKEWK